MAAQPQPDPIPTPERVFRADLEEAPFAAGADRGWWRVRLIDWPFAVIEIAVAPRPNGPGWLALRFELSAYPEAPSGQPWDADAGTPLPPLRWPGGNERIMHVFNPGWRTDALYFPMDRLALDGHDAWRLKHACHLWDPGKDVTQYLRRVHELLNDEGYTGERG